LRTMYETSNRPVRRRISSLDTKSDICRSDKKETDKQRQTDRQTDRQTKRQTHYSYNIDLAVLLVN